MEAAVITSVLICAVYTPSPIPRPSAAGGGWGPVHCDDFNQSKCIERLPCTRVLDGNSFGINCMIVVGRVWWLVMHGATLMCV